MTERIYEWINLDLKKLRLEVDKIESRGRINQTFGFMENGMKSKGEITRDHILESARNLFNSKGFNATTINDLVEAAGVKKGGLYFHFSGKEDIAREVIKEASREFMEFLDKALAGDNPGYSLYKFFECALNKHLATAFVGGCIFGNTALEMSDSNQELATVIAKVFDEWIDKIDLVVERAQKSRQIRSDIKSTVIAQNIVATFEGAIMMSRLKKNERYMREALESLKITLELKTEY